MQRYFITDRKAAGGFRALLDIIRDQMDFGLDYLQIREKDLGARQVFDFTLAVLEARAAMRVPIRTKVLVNTRSDVAWAAKADGVHLPARAPRAVLPGLIVARSCHSVEEIRGCGADLVTFGPVFVSPGKGGPQGLEQLRQACQSGVPVFALGGITWENAEDCVRAGATGVAGIRLFQEP